MQEEDHGAAMGFAQAEVVHCELRNTFSGRFRHSCRLYPCLTATIHLHLENCGTHQQPNKEKHPPHVVWVVTSHFSWKRKTIAAETMHAVALWDRIKEPQGSLWHQVQRRTHHNPIRTHQVGRLLRGADGEVSEETQRIVQEQFKGITPTVLTEDSIRVDKLGEVSQNIKRVFKNNVEMIRHRIRPLQWRSQTVRLAHEQASEGISRRQGFHRKEGAVLHDNPAARGRMCRLGEGTREGGAAARSRALGLSMLCGLKCSNPQ